ncbi:pimeloyl-ACP methyl ester carboxylesterase [Pseudoxanthomonas japonensis]|uniref:alpha/beta hydrolase n=1 Tax=Pseudoxanthomonas japonensis TaxID=69284 RepID=UPI0028618BC0|nr:alpha/beta hydrolase [Pseudoxanthomonas japonensis]MDR7070065.1 pimeloyl-ACP methyl ester carboxylesterase [Pseudoxanthomonas japonensis]
MRWSIVFASILIIAVCSGGSPKDLAPQPGEIRTSHHYLLSGMSIVRYELGHIYVPENRNRPNSRLIAVRYMRIKGEDQPGTPPVFMLPGGPGDSYIEAFTKSGLDWFGAVRQRNDVLRFRRAGDVVVMDQRGASGPSGRLSFNHNPDGQPLDRPAVLADELEAAPSVVRRALARYPDHDLAGYTVIQCAEDLDDLRQALGYTKVNLFGLSYGSQWSFAVMRLHPGTVSRALLSGVEPLDNSYDMPSHVWAALMRVAAEAEADPRLRASLPQGGLRQAIDEILAHLEKDAVSVRLQSGEQIVLGPEDFRLSLLARPSEWPARIIDIHRGRYEAWAEEVAATRRPLKESSSALIGPLIDTSLNVSEIRGRHLEDDPAVQYLGTWGFVPAMAAAPLWPTPDVGDALRLPEESPIPVVFLHGDWDTSTPIENSREIQPYFPNSRLVVVRRGGHGAIYDLADQNPDALDQLLDYLRTGDMTDLPTEIVIALPKFDTPLP